MNSPFEIIDFYNSGAQVQIPAKTSDMRRSFTASRKGGGEPVEIGYEPRGNAKLSEGADHDELEHGGKRHLLLKGGHVYDVKVDDTLHVISAEDGHVSLPVPADAEVDVSEHDPNAEPLPEVDEDGKPVTADEGDDEDAAGDDEDAAADEEE